MDIGPLVLLSSRTSALPVSGTKRFRKEIIKVGDYMKGDSLKFSVDAALLKHWESTFNKMHADGEKVFVPLDHSFKAEDNRGFVTSMEVQGDSLYAEMELLPEAESLVSTCDVSIYSPPAFVNGQGNRYVRPICHVALTPVPLIPGLSEFTIAASKISVLSLAQGATIMDIEKLSKLLECDPTEEAIAAAIVALKVPKKEPEVVASSEAVSTLPEPKIDKPDAALIEARAENFSFLLSNLVLTGKITPVVKTRIEKLVSDDLTLSCAEPTVSRWKSLVAILADNAPVSLGVKTGIQVVELPKGEDVQNPLMVDINKRFTAK